MLLPDHHYKRAENLQSCLQDLGANAAVTQIVGGGTDVIFNMRLKLFQPDVALSIRRLGELQQVEDLPDGGLRIGAGCRLAVLEKETRIDQRYPALAEAIRSVASTHIRNMATLGGNICLQTRCWYTNNSEQWREGIAPCYKTDGDVCHVVKSSKICHAINNSDTPIALIMLGATLTLQSAGATRDVPIAEFYRPDGIDFTVLEPDEMVTHVTLPPVGDRTTFIKIAPRKGMDFSLAAVAARCDGKGEDVKNVTVVLGSLSTAPIVLKEPVRIVTQAGLNDAAIEKAVAAVRPELGELTNLFGRAAYKAHLAKVLVKRALNALREM